MDLVGYKESAYIKVLEQFTDFASRLENVTDITFIPLSALKGDNVVDRSENMTWYKGPPLLYHLENVYVGSDFNHVDARFPVNGSSVHILMSIMTFVDLQAGLLAVSLKQAMK